MDIDTFTDLGSETRSLELKTDIVDHLGRKVGGLAWVRPDGTGWSIAYTAARNGKAYGASNGRIHCSSLALALDVAHRKLTETGKRYEKLADKGEKFSRRRS